MAKPECCAGPYRAGLLKLFGEFATFGATAEGGVRRLAASAADKQARDHLCAWLDRHGFEVVVDPVGNIFGILALRGGEGDAYFFCGSHLDSQPHGGRYDGTLGVASACYCALAIRQAVEEGALLSAYSHIVVACWTGEEGARFQPSILGSSTFCGALQTADVLAIRDENGISLHEALSEIGYQGNGRMPRPSRYAELHIEQGPLLERSGKAVGLVDRCWGATKLRIAVLGRPDHTGPTPMQDRRDALLVAARIIAAVNDRVLASAAPAHGSVARMVVEPNSPNTVAERVELWIELRSGDSDALRRIGDQLTADMAQLAEREGCGSRWFRARTGGASYSIQWRLGLPKRHWLMPASTL